MPEQEVQSPVTRPGSKVGSGQPKSPGAFSNPSRGSVSQDSVPPQPSGVTSRHTKNLRSPHQPRRWLARRTEPWRCASSDSINSFLAFKSNRYCLIGVAFQVPFPHAGLVGHDKHGSVIRPLHAQHFATVPHVDHIGQIHRRWLPALRGKIFCGRRDLRRLLLKGRLQRDA